MPQIIKKRHRFLVIVSAWYMEKNDSYFQQHSSNVLRHLGAHYWLSKTNYNYGIIAEVGGWHTIDELKKSYGKIPPEKILELLA